MKDKELLKIQGVLNRVSELESFMYSGEFSDAERTRIRKYVGNRLKYFFEWFLED